MLQNAAATRAEMEEKEGLKFTRDRSDLGGEAVVHLIFEMLRKSCCPWGGITREIRTCFR